MFENWGSGAASWVFGSILITLVLALIIELAINFARWLIGLRDWS
jgi:hypothetical protein